MKKYFDWYNLLFVVMIGMNIYVIFRALNSDLPLGDEPISAVVEIGKAMQQLSLKDFFISLISSFRWEDHLWPVMYLYGFFLSLVTHDSYLAVKIASKIVYLLIIGGTVYLSYEFWKSKSRALFVFLLISLNFSQYWWYGIVGTIFPPANILTLTSLLFIKKYIDTSQNRFFVFFCLSFILMIFSGEVVFVTLPLFMVFVLLYTIDYKKEYLIKKIIKISYIGLTMLLALASYLFIHHYLIGRLLPGPRTTGELNLDIVNILLNATFPFNLTFPLVIFDSTVFELFDKFNSKFLFNFISTEYLIIICLFFSP